MLTNSRNGVGWADGQPHEGEGFPGKPLSIAQRYYNALGSDLSRCKVRDGVWVAHVPGDASTGFLVRLRGIPIDD